MTPNHLKPDTFTAVTPADLKPNERIIRRKKLKFFLKPVYKPKKGGHTTTIIGTPSFDGTKDKSNT